MTALVGVGLPPNSELLDSSIIDPVNKLEQGYVGTTVYALFYDNCCIDCLHDLL